MTRIRWDTYGDRYTTKDRDLDEKRAKGRPGYCSICDRREPCRFHGEVK